MPDAGTAAVEAFPTQIAGQLRSMIARGTLAPGTRLGQTELAEQFEASRVPVREALKLLSSEGLVDHDPNRGFFVAKLSRDEARQLFRLRDLIEDDVLATLPWPTDAQLADITARAITLEDLLDKGDRAAWWQLHREFHHTIFDFSPEKIMVREAMRLWMLTDRFRALLGVPRRDSASRNVLNKHVLVEALSLQNRAMLVRVRRERRRSFETLVMETLEDRGL